MPVWEVGEDEPEEQSWAACQFCLADLPDGEAHKPWCPTRGEVQAVPRRTGKTKHVEESTQRAIETGLHIHTYGPDGAKCYNGSCVLKGEK